MFTRVKFSLTLIICAFSCLCANDSYNNGEAKSGGDCKKEFSPVIETSFDLLYFKAISDDSSFVFKTEKGLNTSTSGNWGGSFITPSWEYEPGFRMGLATPLRWGDWKIAAGWTFVRNESNTVSEKSNTYNLFNRLASASLISFQNSFSKHANGSWKSTINLFDLALKSAIIINKTYKITPSMGINSAVIQQELKVKFSDFLIPNPLFPSVVNKVVYEIKPGE